VQNVGGFKFQGFRAFIDQTKVMFYVLVCFVCSGISEKHTASTFRLADLIPVDAAVLVGENVSVILEGFRELG
jgi:hypothetical protein